MRLKWRTLDTACICKTPGPVQLATWADTRKLSKSSAWAWALFLAFCSLNSAFGSLLVSWLSLRKNSDSGDPNSWWVSQDSFVCIWDTRSKAGSSGIVWRNGRHLGAQDLLCRDEHMWDSTAESQAVLDRLLWPFCQCRCSLHFASWSYRTSPGNKI